MLLQDLSITQLALGPQVLNAHIIYHCENLILYIKLINFIIL